MCGITGYRVIDGSGDGLEVDLREAVASLRHRGPDDTGQWTDRVAGVGLGFRRLSILDLTPAGHQPMISSCGEWVMVFNGEIYNFRAIRAELESRGRCVRSTGDAEVILEAFAEWGPYAVERFVGMFAIALWHAPTRCLHLLRDRVGVKPLYYRWDGNAIMFGSELKAVRAYRGWTPEIDGDALGDYLQFGYIADPRSIYRDVFKLPPGHRAELAADGRLTLHRYWSLPDRLRDLHGRSEADLAEELEALMVEAFSYRLIADVPVGVFLSGGVDSSVVAAILQQHAGQALKTFTIGFDRPEFDESPYAEAVARHLGTEHHSRTLRLDDAKQLLPRWGDLFDEPFGDESGIPTLMVSQTAAEHVKVVLSADGGDELFSGYNAYGIAIDRWERLRRIPGPGRRALGAALRPAGAAGRALPTTRTARRLSTLERSLSARSAGEFYERSISHIGRADVAALLGSAPPRRASPDAYQGLPGERFCFWDFDHYLPGDVLTKVDRATMAASIEGREPLLDHRLVELAFSLPFSLRRGELGPKHLLKRVLYKHVPRELVERPKRGFAVPVTDWIAGDLRGLVADHCAPSELARHGLFEPTIVRRWLDRMDRGDLAMRRRVWFLLSFQMWYQRWIAAP